MSWQDPSHHQIRSFPSFGFLAGNLGGCLFEVSQGSEREVVGGAKCEVENKGVGGGGEGEGWWDMRR